MLTDLDLIKPAPIVIDDKLESYSAGTEVKPIIEALDHGKFILIKGYYSDGITLLKELHEYLKLKLPNKTFTEQQEYRAEFHKLSNLILLEVVDQELKVKKAPSIGWLERFYAGNDHFLLSFPQIQGLNSSWQWFKNE